MFCANVGDGILTAHPALKGTKIQTIKDKDGKALGEEMMKIATKGKVGEVTYMWPRPGDTTPVQKVSFVMKSAIRCAASATTNSWRAAAMLPEHVETLIVGGGQAGLTMSHMLSRRGCPHLVLERGRIGERWRSERWDGLRFQFPNWSVQASRFSVSATRTPTGSPRAPKSSTTSTPMHES